MATFNVQGHLVHAHEEGETNSRVAILIHGWSSSWYAVSPLLPLLKNRYRCLAVDLPGYGESPALPHRVAIGDYADLIVGLIEQVSPQQPVTLVGHSMGGMTSITVALKRPELVERMVLLCPTISGKLSMFINLFMTPFVLLERFRLTRKLVEVLEPPLFSITDRVLRPALFADQTGIQEKEYLRIRADARRKGQGRVRAECFWAMRQHDLRPYLEQVKPPALLIWGMEDNTVPLRDASAVARKWPEADLRVVPNAGHWPQFETPQTTERYVRAFLSTPIKLLTMDFS
ncbi:MAG: alpha/beta fold hydrolase [Chloroflexota bacterium]